MIDVDEAQRIVLAHTGPLPAVELPLAAALYRTLAAPVICEVDYPPFDRSVMDGYAVRAADTATTPVTLRVVGQIPAGTQSDRTLQPGEAMQINTGAPIPPGADAVVRVENTALASPAIQGTNGKAETRKAESINKKDTKGVGIQESAQHAKIPEVSSTNGSQSDGAVVVHGPVRPGEFITRRGAYARAGQTVLGTGSILTPINIGAAAAAGAARVHVRRKPTVAILVTGDELIDVADKPVGPQIRNSNQYLMESLVRAAYCEPIVLGVARDDRIQLRRKIEEGLGSDLLCITGGVSVGAFDFVPDVLKECGAKFGFHKIAIKPGRPTIFATAPTGSPIFALPGNPAGAVVGFHLVVAPALAALEGRPGVQPLVRALLRGTLSASGGRRTYQPARIAVNANGEFEAHVLSWHGSGDAIGMADADALIVQAPQSPASRDGDAVMVLLAGRI